MVRYVIIIYICKDMYKRVKYIYGAESWDPEVNVKGSIHVNIKYLANIIILHSHFNRYYITGFCHVYILIELY